MRKYLTLILFLFAYLSSFAHGNWYPKKDFGGDARWYAIGFSIGNKGYIGTGGTVGGLVYDFWEWEPVTDVWTQKAAYPEETGIQGAYGISVGTKAYVVGGYNGTISTKFVYEYNQSTNVWQKKSDYNKFVQFGFGFGIDSLAYFGGGTTGTVVMEDLWAFDPSNNTWTQKANYGGGVRHSAVAFTINNKGYVGTGRNATAPVKDFYEYDPGTNRWTVKAAFGGDARFAASGFSIGNKGYIGGGRNNADQFYDWWEYDQSLNRWSQMAHFRGGQRFYAVAFSIGDYGYCGTGASVIGANTFIFKDIWVFKRQAPGFYFHPEDTLVCTGDSVILTVLGWGGNVEYKWQHNDVDISAFSTDTFLILFPVKASDHGYYKCIIKNEHYSDTSIEAYVSVSDGAAKFLKQTEDIIGCRNFKDTLFVSAQSNSSMTFKWYKNGEEILDAIDSFLPLHRVTPSDSGYYYCVITNLCGDNESDSIKVSLYPDPPKPTITQAWSQLTCNPDALTYQWKKYNSNIPGATNKMLVITEHAKYSVEISDANGCKNISDEGTFKPSSINEDDGKKPVSIYPNPTNGKFRVVFDLNEAAELIVVNMLGEKIYSESIVSVGKLNMELDVSFVESGAYYLIVRGENIYFTEKLFIQK